LVWENITTNTPLNEEVAQHVSKAYLNRLLSTYCKLLSTSATSQNGNLLNYCPTDNTDHDITDQQYHDRKEEAAYAAHMKQIAATNASP